MVFIISSCVYLFGLIVYTGFADCEAISCPKNEEMKNKEIIFNENENYLDNE